MTEIRLLLVEDERHPFEELRQALKKSGYEITICSGVFDALDELSAQGADAVIASTTLSDLSGYQMCSLIKSNDRTCRLPVVLTNCSHAEQDAFWHLAAQADAVYTVEQTKTPTEIVEKISKLIEESRNLGWKSSLVKNWLIPSTSFSSANLITSYGALLDNLLIERMVTRSCRTLSALIEPRHQFAEAYLALVSQMYQPDLLGIAVANSADSWAAYQVKPSLAHDSFTQLSAKVSKQLGGGKDLETNIFGKLEDAGNAIAEYETLPVMTDKGQGILIFGSMQKKSFNATARAFMTQLQSHMQPVLQLLLAKEEIQVLQNREAYRASTDPLTGLYNLEFLVGFLQQQLLFSFRQRLAVGMAIIDIDNFGELNKDYGVEAGDAVITTIANRLMTITRSSDLIARYGGDEFAVVLPNTDIKGVKILGEKVRHDIEQLSFSKGSKRKGPKVTVSVGCSHFNMEDLNPESILRDAKLALQKAKESGRNCVSVYE